MAKCCCWCDAAAVRELEYGGRKHPACRYHACLYGDEERDGDGYVSALVAVAVLGCFFGGLLSWFCPVW